jgi:PII-like signaling protein
MIRRRKDGKENSKAIIKTEQRVSIIYQYIIEVVDERSTLEPMLSQINRMFADNGLVAIQRV